MSSTLQATAYLEEEFTTPNLYDSSYCFSILNSLVVPRPIAFITSIGERGIVNAAPFSYFNVVCTNPPMVSVAIEKREGLRKDTARNIFSAKEFVVNICSIEIAKAISIAGGDYPAEMSEVELAKLSLLPSKKIQVPRIANTLAQLECVLKHSIEVGNDPTDLILAEVVLIHLHESITEQGRIDIQKLNPLARLSGSTFAKVGDYFDIKRGI